MEAKMQRLATFSTGIVLLAGAFGYSAGLQNSRSDRPDADVERVLALDLSLEIMGPSGAGHYADRYQSAFKGVSADGIARLKVHADDGVSIRAAWETVVRTIPEKIATGETRPDRDKLNWFLGFIEGRLRVQVPEAWAADLLNCHAIDRRTVYPGTPYKGVPHQAGLYDIRSALDTTLTKNGKQIVLTVGKASVPIPEYLVERAKRDALEHTIEGLFTPACCYVAVHRNVGYPFDVVCIDRSAGRTIWQNTVRATWFGFSNGGHEMHVTLAEQQSRLVVFGSGTDGLFVEVFRSADGVCLCRFATSY
jgi:hypothetical protein